MARKKTPSAHTKFNADLSLRLREIRKELFGEHGGPELARRLDPFLDGAEIPSIEGWPHWRASAVVENGDYDHDKHPD